MTNHSGSAAALLPVRVVLRRTGLSADVLRAWERRYGAVRPARSAGGRRLYGDAEVERLVLLKRLTSQGHSIGQVARLTTAELASLVERERRQANQPDDTAGDVALHEAERDAQATMATDAVHAALEATARLDAAGLERGLRRTALSLGPLPYVTSVAGPFLRQVGERWHDGVMSVAQEHLATASTRAALQWIVSTLRPPIGAPCVVVATLAGERHELGALMSAAVAAGVGWSPLYLGSDMPAAELAAGARSARAAAVAVSGVYGSAEVLGNEVERLRDALPAGVPVFLGGAAYEAVAARLTRLPAVHVVAVDAFAAALRSLGAAPRGEAR